MGYFSSSSTTESESKTAPLSEEGLELQSMFTSLMMQQFDTAGYIPKTEEKTKFEDPTKASNLQNQIATYDKQIADLEKDLEINPAIRTQNQGGGRLAPAYKEDPRTEQLKKLNDEKFKAQNDLNKIPQTTYTDYSFEKKPDPRLANAIDKYGAESPQAKAIQEEIKQEEVYTAETKAEITKSYLEKSKKLVNGDYSYTPEQKAQTSQYFEPIKDTLSKTTDMLISEVNANQENLFDYVNKYMDQIDKTGFDTLDALNAALVQVEKSGQNLMSIAEGVNQKYENKAKFEFDLLSQKADQKAANQAALMGLPPGSMMEKKQAASMKYNALQGVLLGLEVDEANRMLGIASQTESEKKSISLSKADLALQQGGKREQAAGTALDIASASGQQKMNVKGAYAQNLLGIEQDKMNLLFNAAVGQLPQQVSGGQGFLGFGEAVKSGQMNQTAAAMAPAQWGLGIEQQRTFQESKNKSTTTTSPSIFSAISSGISTAAGAAGGIMGGLGAMQPVSPINIFGTGTS